MGELAFGPTTLPASSNAVWLGVDYITMGALWCVLSNVTREVLDSPASANALLDVLLQDLAHVDLMGVSRGSERWLRSSVLASSSSAA
jgi:hypothetical protein